MQSWSEVGERQSSNRVPNPVEAEAEHPPTFECEGKGQWKSEPYRVSQKSESRAGRVRYASTGLSTQSSQCRLLPSPHACLHHMPIPNARSIRAEKKTPSPNFPYWGTLGLLVAIVVGTIAISSWITVEWGQGRYRMGWEQAVLSRSFETLIGLWFFAVGSSIASFLNVVAYRLPRRISINGFSRCPFCKVGIHGYDNIPLFGWLGLRGRCRACRLPIPARYPGFELLGGVIALGFFGFEFLQHGTNLPNVVDTSSSHGMLTGRMDWESWTRVLEHLVLIYWLLAVAMITWGLQVVPMRLYGTGALALLGWVLVYPSFYPVAIWPGWMDVESNTMSDATALWRNAYVHAALQWCVGGIVGACLAVGMWFCGRMAKPIAEEFATPMFASWIGAWILIGNALGWYAVLSTACLSIVIYGAKVSLIKMLGFLEYRTPSLGYGLPPRCRYCFGNNGIASWVGVGNPMGHQPCRFGGKRTGRLRHSIGAVGTRVVCLGTSS